jgi:hypothetical protein
MKQSSNRPNNAGLSLFPACKGVSNTERAHLGQNLRYDVSPLLPVSTKGTQQSYNNSPSSRPSSP